MDDTVYRIKLYGQTGDDPEIFCGQAGPLLGVGHEQARKLLERAPVIVKDGLDKNQAIQLLRAIKAINGLAMLERSDGTLPVSALEATYGPDAHFAFPTPGRSGSPGGSDAEEGRVQWSFRIWAGLLIGIATLAVILGSVAYFQSYRQVSAEQERLDKMRSERSGALRKARDSQEKPKLETEITDLREQIRSCESALEASKLDVIKKQNAYTKVYNESRGTETAEVILARNEMEGARAGIRESQGILADLKKRLGQAEERHRLLEE